MAKKDFYNVLGVERDATPEQIKAAYRKLVMKFHPDVNKDSDATQKMTEINEAYDTLSDPKKKQMYDMYGEAGVNNQQGFGGEGFGRNSNINMNDFFRQSGFGGGTGSIFDDIFSAFSGSSRQQSRTKPMGRPGSDIPFKTSLTYKEVLHGKKLKIELDRFVPCEECGGSGAKKGTHPETCSTCKGSGYVQQQQQSFFGVVNTVSECPTCGGTGKVIKEKCEKCNGFGRIRKKSTIELSIPPNIPEGTKIRYSNYGNAGINGGAIGDLIVTIHYKHDKRFKKDGINLIYEHSIPFTKGILGTSFSAPTIDSAETIKVLPGTQSGKEVVLKGKGLPNNRRRKGDIIVRILVDIPPISKLSKNQKKYIQEIDKDLS